MHLTLSCLIPIPQGDAERSLERLHEAAERVLGQHVARAREHPNAFDVAAFQEFRKNLIGAQGGGVQGGARARAGAEDGTRQSCGRNLAENVRRPRSSACRLCMCYIILRANGPMVVLLKQVLYTQ